MVVLAPEARYTHVLKQLGPAGPLFLDTETTGLDPRKNRLVLIQLHRAGDERAVVLDWRRPTLEDRAKLQEVLDGASVLVGHNLKFDLHFLREAGLAARVPLHDTAVCQKVLQGEGAQDGVSYALADVLRRCYRWDLDKEARKWFFAPAPLDERDDWHGAIPDEELAYAALDVQVLPRLYEDQCRWLRALGLAPTFDLEMRALPALLDMERAGVRVDLAGWRAVIAEKRAEAEALEGKLLAHVAAPILDARVRRFDTARAALAEWEHARDLEVTRLADDFDSTRDVDVKEMGWGAFKALNMKTWRAEHPRPETPKLDTRPPNVGSQEQLLDAFRALDIPAPATDARTLADYQQYEPVRLLGEHRKARKFVDAFGESLLAGADAQGRIHPTYNAIGAATGRMSCENPNWQQVPSKGDGKRLRACVIPAPGCKLVTADFSNIELRILAALSRDETLIELFASGTDLHSEMARRMFHLAADPKTTFFRPGWTYRETAKKINYGLVYGMSATRLAAEMAIPRTEAETVFDAYFAVLPGVRDWLEEQRAGVHAAGRRDLPANGRTVGPLVTWTLLGRRRRYPEPTTRGEWGRVERQACNSPIQGTSADITKLAVALYHEEPAYGHLVAVVHDELVVETPERRAEATAIALADAMNMAQARTLGHLLPCEALPRPVPAISDHWEHD